MAKRTMAKFMRGFDMDKDVTGKPVVKKRDTLRDPEPRQGFELDCGDAGKLVVMCSEGQMINPWKMCKRAGGTFIPPKKVEEEKEVEHATKEN